MSTWNRRQVIKTVIAGAGVTLWPWQRLLAQNGTALLRAPKQALVIGNSKYRDAPLKNPINDARGISDALKGIGFAVTLATELTRPATAVVMRSFTDNLAKTKAVGLFYYAGHGAQLAWRNYMIPIDADIGNADELREQGVDL